MKRKRSEKKRNCAIQETTKPQVDISFIIGMLRSSSGHDLQNSYLDNTHHGLPGSTKVVQHKDCVIKAITYSHTHPSRQRLLRLYHVYKSWCTWTLLHNCTRPQREHTCMAQ